MGINIKEGVKIDKNVSLVPSSIGKRLGTTAATSKIERATQLAQTIIADPDAVDAATFNHEHHGKKVDAANLALASTEVVATAIRGAIKAPVVYVASTVGSLAWTGIKGVVTSPVKAYNYAFGPSSSLPGLPVSVADNAIAERQSKAEVAFEGLLTAIGKKYPPHFRELRSLEPQILKMMVESPELLEIAQHVEVRANGRIANRTLNKLMTLPSSAEFFGTILTLGRLAKQADMESGDAAPGELPVPLNRQNTSLTREIASSSTIKPLKRSEIMASKKHHEHFIPKALLDKGEDEFNNDVVSDSIEHLDMQGSWFMRVTRFALTDNLLAKAAAECGQELDAGQLRDFILKGHMPPSNWPVHAALLSPGETTTVFTRTKTGKPAHSEEVQMPFEIAGEGSFTRSLLALCFAGQNLSDAERAELSQESAFVVRIGSDEYAAQTADPIVEAFSAEKVKLNDGTMRNVYNTNLEAGVRPYINGDGYGKNGVVADGTRIEEKLESASVLKVWSSNPKLQAFVEARLNSDDRAIKRQLGILNIGVIRGLHYVSAADIKEACCEVAVPTLGGALIEGMIEGAQKVASLKLPAYATIVEKNQFYKDPGYFASNILGFGTGLWDDSTGAGVKLTQTMAARGKKVDDKSLGVPEGATALQRFQHKMSIVRHGGLPAAQEEELIARGADPVVAQGYANVWRRVLIMGSVNVGVTSGMVILINNPATTWGPLFGATAALTLVNAGVIPFDLVRTTIDKVRVRKHLIESEVIKAGMSKDKFAQLWESWDTAVRDITNSIEGKSAVIAFTFVGVTLPWAWALLNAAPNSELLRELLQAGIFGATPGWENFLTLAMSGLVRSTFKARLNEFFNVGFVEGIERAHKELENNGSISPEVEAELIKEYEGRYDSTMRGTASLWSAKAQTLWTMMLPAMRKSAPIVPSTENDVQATAAIEAPETNAAFAQPSQSIALSDITPAMA